MPDFNVVSAERFPDQLNGFIAPDDGEHQLFINTVANFYGTTISVIGLFISEYTTRLSIPKLYELVEGADDKDGLEVNLCGIVTFGVHKDTTKIGTTHLDIVASELRIPLLRLAKPPEYPDYDHEDEKPYTEKWIKGNSLVDLYFKQVTIERFGTTATIRQL